MTTYHPRKNDHGKPVALAHPCQPTALSSWNDPDLLASVTPDAPMPSAIDGLDVLSWKHAPADAAGWERLAALVDFDEPPFLKVPGKAPASGAVVVEADGRVWVVSPSNQFGGYTNTFPKGKLDSTKEISLRANALKEVFEESGLHVALTGFLCDSVRSTSVTRYYLARRVGGNPAAMGWESEAVHLVPESQLPAFVAHHNDKGILEALRQRHVRRLTRAEILLSDTLGSAYRILTTIEGFRAQHRKWPTRVRMAGEMAKGIQEQLLTPLGWALLASKLELVQIDKGTVIAEDGYGARYEYGDVEPLITDTRPAEQWIWGVTLSAAP